MILAMLLLAATSCVPLPTCTDNGDVSPCATPTPVVSWDQVADADLAGYSIYWRDTGSGGFNVLAQIACRWDDLDDPPDGIAETRFCLGADFPIPLQRWCPQCAPYQSYEFAIKTYDNTGNRSADYSNIIEVCFSPIWTSGPYN